MVLSRKVPSSDFYIKSFRQLCGLNSGKTSRDGKISQQVAAVVQGNRCGLQVGQ